MKRALVPLADGFEEIEAVTVIDVLRRAGVDVTVAGLEEGPRRGSRGVVVVPDRPLTDVVDQEFDVIVLPGGLPGATHLRDDERVTAMLRRALDGGRLVAAICAAPTVLAAAGMADGRRMTCHPSVEDAMRDAGAALAGDRVAVDGPFVTSQSPGTAMEFAFRLVELLCGADKVAELNAGILARAD